MRRGCFEALWPLFAKAQRPAKELTESYSALVHLRPFLTGDGPHRVVHVQQGVLGPTSPQFWVYNPAFAQVQNEHVFMTGWMDIIQNGMTPLAATEKAFKRVAEIFAKYPMA